MTDENKIQQMKDKNELFKQQLAENLYNRIDNNVPLTRNQRDGIKGIIEQTIIKEVQIQDEPIKDKPKNKDK